MTDALLNQFNTAVESLQRGVPLARQDEISADLAEFRSVWDKNRRWGFKRGSEIAFPMKLQPLTHNEMEFVRDEAMAYYWGGFYPHADLAVSKQLASPLQSHIANEGDVR